MFDSTIKSNSSCASNLSILTPGFDNYQITPCQQDKAKTSYFEVIALTTGAVIGMTNMVVVLVIAGGGRKLRKVTFFCICNLAVGDMLAGLMLLWIFGLQKIVLPFRTPTSELFQKAIWAMTVWSSMFSQLVIAIDRFLCVTQRKREKSTCFPTLRWEKQRRRRYVKAGIALTWLIPFFSFVVPVTIAWNCSSNCNCYKQCGDISDVYYMICLPIHYCSLTSPTFSKGSMLYLGLSLLGVPTLPCILYIKIFYTANKSAKKARPSQQNPISPVTNSTEAETRSLPHRTRNSKYTGDDIISRNSSRIVRVIPVSSCNSSEERSSETQFACETVNFNKTGTITRTGKKSSQKRNFLLAEFHNKTSTLTRTLSARERLRLKPLIKASGTLSKTIAKFKQKREQRLLRTLIIILALLVLSTVPLGILFIISYGETDKRYVTAAKYILTGSLINSMVNPWIYFWRFLEMRAAFKNMFCASLC